MSNEMKKVLNAQLSRRSAIAAPLAAAFAAVATQKATAEPTVKPFTTDEMVGPASTPTTTAAKRGATAQTTGQVASTQMATTTAARKKKPFTSNELLIAGTKAATKSKMRKPDFLPFVVFVMMCIFRIILASAVRSISGKTLLNTLYKQGATFIRQKGSHVTIEFNGRRTQIPNNNHDLPIKTLNSIRDALGIPR